MSSPADRRTSGFEPDRLVLELTRDFPAPDSYWVGFSGGLDSAVLLAALAAKRDLLSAPLYAIHVDHGLQAASGQWAAHCREVCAQFGVALTVIQVDARPARGESPEAAAREARYRAIETSLPPQAMLLTAHHRDDQAETLLLQLMRGAGVAGLAAMPPVKSFGAGWHVRPLLNASRRQLNEWAKQQGLEWIDDPTNASTAPDRNFLRHKILPSLHDRWPAAATSLSRSASHCAGALEALQQQAGEDLDRVRLSTNRVGLDALGQLSAFRQRALLLCWFEELGATAPGSAEMQELVGQLLRARKDAAVCFDIGDFQVRRYAGAAWLIEPPLSELPDGDVPWPAGQDSVVLAHGRVTRRRGSQGIAERFWDGGDIRIGFRRESLACQPAGRDGRRTFKAIAQENRIPPWQRPFVPVIWVEGKLAAIANCCVCEPFAASAHELGWVVEWSPDQNDGQG